MSGPRVTERKRRLDGSSVEYPCEGLVVEPGLRALLRYGMPSERRLEGTDLILHPGTVTVGHFRPDRAYTVYSFAKDGRIVGRYCSIVDDLTVGADRVDYLDLVVDVLIEPSGASVVLDEHELPEDLEPRYRRIINKALEELTGNTKRLVAELDREAAPYLVQPAPPEGS